MDQSPLKRALRKFSAGRPSKQPVNTPLGALAIAVEQRDRLAALLEEEKVDGHITTTAIITRHWTPGIEVPYTEDTFVEPGAAWKALKYLEDYAEQGSTFVVSGLTFVVETPEAADVFMYALDRTPEGYAAFLTQSGEHRVRVRRPIPQS